MSQKLYWTKLLWQNDQVFDGLVPCLLLLHSTTLHASMQAFSIIILLLSLQKCSIIVQCSHDVVLPFFRFWRSCTAWIRQAEEFSHRYFQCVESSFTFVTFECRMGPFHKARMNSPLPFLVFGKNKNRMTLWQAPSRRGIVFLVLRIHYENISTMELPSISFFSILFRESLIHI